MKNEFIPYEQALELKELGFDEPCLAFYNGKFLESTDYNFDNSTSKDIGLCIVAPTFSQAFRWFREKYNLNGILNHYPNTKLWDFSVHDLTWSGKEFIEHVKKEDRSVKYSTYEEAELACLKKLIEIAKNK
jgi:hypothetical protein